MILTTLEEISAARKGKRLVFTNGVFDIIHAGHISYLEEAKALGDLLIVGLNSDESVKMLGKGPNRPINPLADRTVVIGALRCVNGVLSFSEKTPEGLIAQLKPDVHVKGGDYKVEDLPESKIVYGYGGEVVILPFLAGRSTTKILERISE